MRYHALVFKSDRVRLQIKNLVEMPPENWKENEISFILNLYEKSKNDQHRLNENSKLPKFY